MNLKKLYEKMLTLYPEYSNDEISYMIAEALINEFPRIMKKVDIVNPSVLMKYMKARVGRTGERFPEKTLKKCEEKLSRTQKWYRWKIMPASPPLLSSTTLRTDENTSKKTYEEDELSYTGSDDLFVLQSYNATSILTFEKQGSEWMERVLNFQEGSRNPLADLIDYAR